MNLRRYYLNPKIKKVNIVENYTREEVEEYIKCSKDPKYFIENYMKIISLDQGLVNFTLRGYQNNLIDTYHEKNKVLTLSSRQSGKCFYINTVVRVRSKKTGEIKELTIGELYESIKTKNM